MAPRPWSVRSGWCRNGAGPDADDNFLKKHVDCQNGLCEKARRPFVLNG
jgi:hypothetical protein